MLQWTLGYMYISKLWFSQGICPVVGFLGHKVGLFLVFQRISILFSIVSVSIYIPTNRTNVPFSPNPLQALLFVDFFLWWPFWLMWGDILLCFDFHLENHRYFLMRIVSIFSDNCFFFYYAQLFNFWESGKWKITFVV